jgi:hypothetical protein
MKAKLFSIMALAAGAFVVSAQTHQPAEDWKPAPSNMPGQHYPQINSEGRVRACLPASQAQSGQLNIISKVPL